MVLGGIRGERDDERPRGRGLIPVAVVVLATLGMTVAAVGPAAGQSDTVTLTVTVEDLNGDPVGSATVEATWDGGSDRKTTAGNGKVFVDVPAEETVTFTVEHPNYVRNRPFRISTTSDDADVTIPVAPKASVTVVAVNDAGESIEGATVSVVRKGRTVAEGRTGPDGRYSTGDIEAREYEVTVSKPGYFTRRLTEDLNVAVTRQVTLRTGTVEYTFFVRDDHFDSPRPVENATVQVGSVGSVRTLPGGRASIGVPVNTVQEVRVTKPGYDTVTRRVRVGESRENVTIATRRSANVTVSAASRRVVVGEPATVSVRNAYGEPIEGATVLLDGSEVGTTGPDGTLAVRIEERGEHEVRARRNALTSAPVIVEGVVAAGTPTTTPTPTPEEEEGPFGIARGVAPGFGTGAAIVALALVVAVGVLARRRR